MPRLSLWMAWILVLSTSGLVDPHDDSLPTQTCDYVFKVKKGSVIDLHVNNFTQSNREKHYCTVQVTADKHMRVVVDLVYSPPMLAGDVPRLDCSSDYIHVGSDIQHLDVDLMTSYKFCGEEVRHQLISSNNHMWMVYKASQPPRDFFAKVWAHTPVTCTTEEFRCSPVQCVHRSRMCDEVKDCINGHDEFCHNQGAETHSTVFTEPCFRCGDGTCILPRVARYDVSYGRLLWYLCDGFSHCQDSWDERQDICQNLRTGRVGSVLKCVPSDLQFGFNGSVIMWSEVECNSVRDCHHGEDEDNCDRKGFQEQRLHADPVTLGVVVGILTTGCTLFCVVYRLKMVKGTPARPSTSSTVDTKCTQVTSSDHDREEVTSAGPTCSQSVFISEDANLQSCTSDGVNYEDYDDVDDDDEGDAKSLNSLDLRHTIV